MVSEGSFRILLRVNLGCPLDETIEQSHASFDAVATAQFGEHHVRIPHVRGAI